MADEKKLGLARSAFATLCQALDKNDWHYKKIEEDLKIESGASGDDFPIDITIKVDADRGLVVLLSHLPIVIEENKRIDTAIAVSAINCILADGSFDYSIASGHMFFRMTNRFIDNTMGEDAFMYMLLCSCKTVDEFNDKFFMLSKGMISIEKFLGEMLGN